MGSNRVNANQAVAANLKVDASGVAVPVTDNGGSLTVDGSVTVSGTVTASGPLTDAQLRATAVPVSGTVTASGPLTDTQLRATAVPVSGTVTANAGTGTLAVSAAALPLPTGAATSALQAGGLPAALGSGGGLKVDGSGTALPVSGTVTANAGTGTLAVSAASLPLPSGASTAAKQPALGTAGTASADVITVQGVASGYVLAIGLRQTNISQTPTVSTSPAYTIGDALGGLLTFANAARVSGSSGLILGATVMCKTPALVPIVDLYLFNQTFTATSDNAAFAPSDGDMANCIGVITISNWAAETASSLNSIATWRGVHPFLLTGTSLFGQMVIRTSVTAAGTTDFIIGLQVAQD